MEFIEQFGFTQTMIQGLVVLVLVAIFLGLYWRYVAIGAGMLLVLIVFAYKPSVAKVQNVTSSEVVKPADGEVVKPEAPEVKEIAPTDKQVDTWHKQFMEDCMSVTENTKSQCETIWGERIEDEKHPEKMAVNWKKYQKFRARYL